METLVEKEKAMSKMTDDLIAVDLENGGLGYDVVGEMIDGFNIETETWWTDEVVRLWFKKPVFYEHELEGICALGFKVKWNIFNSTEKEMIEKPEWIDNECISEELPEFLTCIKNAEELDEGKIYDSVRKVEEEEEDFDAKTFNSMVKDKKKEILFTHKFKIRHFKDYEKILRFISEQLLLLRQNEEELKILFQDETIKVEKNNEYEVAVQMIDKLRIVKFSDGLYVYNQDHYRNGEYFYQSLHQELKNQKI